MDALARLVQPVPQRFSTDTQWRAEGEGRAAVAASVQPGGGAAAAALAWVQQLVGHVAGQNDQQAVLECLRTLQGVEGAGAWEAAT